MCQSGTTCLPTDCCFSVRVAQHVYPQTVVSVSEWHNMSTHRLLFQWASTIKIMCQSGTTCLPTDCCFSVRVAQHVYPQTVVSVSEWHNMSTHRLLFQWASTIKIMCQSGTTCLPTDCCFSVRVAQHVYPQTVVSVSEWHMSTHRLLFQCQSGTTCLPTDLFQCQSGTTCLPTDCCFSVRVAQHVYPQTVVSVSEWHNMSTHRLLFQCQSGTTCLPTDCCFSVRVAQHVYPQTVVSVG